MGTSTQAVAELDIPDAVSISRPRLSKMKIKNFRCIGSVSVEIELDDIVVLVGPNNSGKSSILRAYQVVMAHGSKEGKLSLDDFPNATVDPNNLPEIELETVIYDKTAPGEKWVFSNEYGEMCVREKWVWKSVNDDPIKVGWDKDTNDWHPSQGPWGAANVAKSYRPQPHRIEAFDPPEKQAQNVIKLLKKALEGRVSTVRDENNTYKSLIKQLSDVHSQILDDAKAEISSVEEKITKTIEQVFPNHIVRFDANVEDNMDDCLSFFASPSLKMGIDGEGHHLSPIDKQGSGAKRTLLWAALKLLAEEKNNLDDAAGVKPNVLLLDEPELCLHPNAVREACQVLYDLPNTNKWQVMVTTHSPVFIDFSRNHMSIVRVERKDGGEVSGTTIFRPKRINFDEDEKNALKLLNVCDPYLAEFFFGGRTIIVEGDTEYTAFKYIISEHPGLYKDVHIVRARGKALIVSLVKILNQFGKPFAVIHDTDTPLNKKGGKNGMWTQNQTIYDAVKSGPMSDKVRLVASIVNFEQAFLNKEVSSEKPYNALLALQQDKSVFDNCKKLLDALLDYQKELPPNVVEWNSLDELEALLLA